MKIKIRLGPQPEQFAKDGSEHGHQVALFCKAAQHFEQWPELRLMYAIPNGGERNIKVAANLKAEGVKASVPDVCLPVARGSWHGLYIELKRPKSEKGPAGRPSQEQLDYIAALKAQGYGALVCVGWQEAWTAIESYLNWR